MSTNDKDPVLAENGKSIKSRKMRLPPFLEQDIDVTNPDKIDQASLLKSLHDKFIAGFKKWKRRSAVFNFAHLAVTLTVILIQVALVIILQIPQLSLDIKHALATILPSLTGAVLAIQMKLSWSEKGAKCKKAARVYNVLTENIEYRLEMLKAGGGIDDTDSIKIWNAALMCETKDVPPFVDVTVLEMKELNERQKAEHANRMYNQMKSSVDEMQTRNSELEQKFSQLTKLNLAAQQTERDLRDELAEVVPRSVSEADRKKIGKLDEELAKAKVKMSKLQDMSDISHSQLQSVQSQQQAREREMKSLRQQLREFQVQTDENALIGKLHHQVLNLQANEVDAQKKLQVTKKNVKKLEAHVLKLEKKIDEKEDSVFLIRTESNNKIRQLKKTIQSLRRQFSGALPLAQQEKFSQSMIRLYEDKNLIQEELRKMRREREKLEDKLAQADIEKEGLEELRKAIEDKRGADKLTEWSHKMDRLRLQDMKLQRQVVRLSEQIKYMENLNNQHEKTISSLEEDIVQLLKSQEQHQVEWEMREMELERMLDQFESQQREVTRKAKRLDEIAETLPDPSLPVDVQLTKALTTIKDQMATIRSLQGQIKGLEYEADQLKSIRQNLESDVTRRDQIITELRRSMPTSKTVTHIAEKMDTDTKQQLRVAMDSMETLKKRLASKEESLNRYKQLLEESRKDLEVAAANHERELIVMQQRIHGKTDDAFTKFKAAATSSASPGRSRALSSEELARLSELEEMVKEQDAAMTALMDRVRAANADVNDQKRKINEARRQAEVERSKLVEEHESVTSATQVKLDGKRRKIEELEKKLSRVSEELEDQKEANTRAPSTTMKNLVARLRIQLEDKEKQQQKLSHALTELRSDLVMQAQENVRAHAAEENDAHNVKVLVDRRTAQYKVQIEELKDRVAELMRGVKQAKRTEENLRGELKKILEETEKKEQAIKKHKMEQKSKETEVIQLREKVKRLIKSRGPDSGLRFVDEKPVKLPAETSDSTEDPDKKDKAEEETVVPVDAGSEQRPTSARSKLPRSRPLSAADADKMRRMKEAMAQLKEENFNLKEKLKLKTDEPNKSAVEIAKWDAKKQWQGKLEALRGKLQDKEKQVQATDKQNHSLRDTIARLEREKLRRPSAPIGPPIHAQGTEEGSVPPSDHAIRQQLHNAEELSRRLHQLGEENSELRKMNVLPRNKFAAELEAKNKQLSDKLEDLQKEILTKGMREARDETLADQFRGRENEMQGRILKLSSDNTQLMFEVEQIKRDVPRLRERVEYQQQYIDLLQTEKKEALARIEKLKGQQQKKQATSGSGKSVAELEKTVEMMKKVVERVQRENEQLKRAPGVVSNQMLDELKAENQLLKNRINEMTQQIGGQLSLRYESKTQSVEKLIRENERLQRDMDKQALTMDKLRNSNTSLQAEKDKLSKQLDSMKKRLEIAESKAPKLAGSGSRGYNSAVTSRMLESRLKKSEDELAKVTSQLKVVNAIVEEKSAAEAEVSEDNERLREQIEILERFPPGAGGSDPNTVRELQVARLTNARLESEIAELRHNAELSRRSAADDVEGAKPKHVVGGDVTLRAENLRLATEVRVKEEERLKAEEEVRRLQEELSNFDADFFDEIEDLKFNYSECVKRNVLYEEQLRNLSKQFGVSVDLGPSHE